MLEISLTYSEQSRQVPYHLIFPTASFFAHPTSAHNLQVFLSTLQFFRAFNYITTEGTLVVPRLDLCHALRRAPKPCEIREWPFYLSPRTKPIRQLVCCIIIQPLESVFDSS